MRPEPDKKSVLLFYLLKKINRCHREHRLLADGDRIALALSGGKDSCTLLDALLQRRGIEKYTLVPIHVIAATDMNCTSQPHIPTLSAWLDQLGIEYYMVHADEVKGVTRRLNQSPCFYCAWRRRKALFAKAQELGCNKLALAHNADDVAQTTLLNLFYQGMLTTMLPRVPLFDGRLTLIRPLSYVPEREIARYAQEANVPPSPPPCPIGDQSRRALMRQVLGLVQQGNPRVRWLLWRAVQRCQATDVEQDLGETQEQID